MDIRGSKEEFIEEVEFNDRMYRVYTASPGRIEAFDGTLATVQMTVRIKTIVNGDTRFLDPPLISHVPVVLPSSMGGGLFITVPIKPGDPCLIVFSQRSIDNVVDLGGIQNPVDPKSNSLTARNRHHDMTDAICIPGLSIIPSAPASWAADAIEIRNAARTVCLSVKADKIYITGDLAVTGKITATGDIVAGTVSAKTHIHPDPVSGNTGAPIP